MSESPAKPALTLLLGLLTMLVTAAAAASIFMGDAPPQRAQESGRYPGLTPREAAEVQLLVGKASPAFEAALDGLAEGPRGTLVLTHLMLELALTDPRKLYAADSLGLRVESTERDRLQRAYLESRSRSDWNAIVAAREALLDWTLDQVRERGSKPLQ